MFSRLSIETKFIIIAHFGIILCVAMAFILGVLIYIFRDLFRTLGGEPAYNANVVSQVAVNNDGSHYGNG